MSQPPAVVLVIVMTAAALGACAREGDFGRPAPTAFQETMLPLVGREMARARGEPVSYFRLTDREKELRTRAYRFVMPIHRRGAFARGRAELVRARIWPDSFYDVDVTLYYDRLKGDGFASSEGPYGAMLSQIAADAMLIAPFYATVRKVCIADAARLAALAQAHDATRDEEADAVGRVYENRRVADWALAGLQWRVASYAHALQRARIEIPAKRAGEVEVALVHLAADVDDLEAAVAALHCDSTPSADAIAGAGGKPLAKR